MAQLDQFNVLVCGAGHVNFGSTEGPWNHTKRLEKLLGPRLRVIGLIDLNEEAAKRRIAEKLKGPAKSSWKDTQVFTNVHAAGESLTSQLKPQLALCGLPPYGRGTTTPGKDTDLQIHKVFPDCTLFVEKPISATSDIDDVKRVAKQLEECITSCGYMFRYLRAVQQMKSILQEQNLHVMATIATYYLPYEFAGAAGEFNRLAYWDRTKDQGPIVSQATHVVDLCRYFGGEVDLDSVATITMEHEDPPANLRLMHLSEDGIASEDRIPRVTSAHWRYQSGAVGSLVHAIALHDGEYDTELTVLADGYRMTLSDPYGTPKLHVRGPGSSIDIITTYDEDDPFESELQAVIAATENSHQRNDILSTYDDAIKTYELTWRIRLDGEARAAQRRRPRTS